MGEASAETRTSYLISAGIHAVIIGALVFVGVGGRRKLAPAPDLEPAEVFKASGVRTGMEGGGIGSSPGPSVPPDQAAPYVGLYDITTANGSKAGLLVTVEKDGADHWSLVAKQGDLASYTLRRIAADSFVQLHDRDFRAVFVRRDSVVTGIEITWLGMKRLGTKVNNSNSPPLHSR